MSYTTDPNDPRLGHGADQKPAPQNEVYLILSDEERAKGFVRPVRRSYIHVGRVDRVCGKPNPRYKDGIDDEGNKWVCAFPKGHEGECVGFGRVEDMKGCGVETTMSLPLCETYARDPKFYGSTYCVGCHMHLPVGEFVWAEDNQVVGS